MKRMNVSEYLFVEKPFLDQLSNLGWTVIDQGTGVPSDPTKSLRTSFRDVTLRDVFNQAIRSINTTETGQQWLTEKQLDDLHNDLVAQAAKGLVETNETVLKLLFRTQVDVNEVTGEQYPNVNLIDFYHPEENQFHAINQFRIDTLNGTKNFITPDIVLFVNGLPLVVIECKDSNSFTANPMEEAFKQLMRYTNEREEAKLNGLKEGEPKLFYTNQLLIRTTGELAQYGTITSTEEEFFYPWKDIHPEQFKTFTPPLGVHRQQETLIQGMLPKSTLLDLIRNCTVFMDVGKIRAKVIARYQQYRAVCKIIDRLRQGTTSQERSGVIWHTQGSGKSLTMVFVIRKIRMCHDLKDYKICLVNDRIDLEEQLGETAELTGEAVTYISSSKDLKVKLRSDSSNLNMVMIHKFLENPNRGMPDYLVDALKDMPVFAPIGIVNESSRILLMIDEAHRTQSGDLGDNLFDAFPNATRLAFTGTPLIKKADGKTTQARFGSYIDKYKLQDAVSDGATLQILYEGKTTDNAINEKAAFDAKVDDLAQSHAQSQMNKEVNKEVVRKFAAKKKVAFDDLMKTMTEEQVALLKQKWGTKGDILEAEKRIEAVAKDIVHHYVEQILPNGFKAQVVCNSKLAAVHYKTFLDQALAARLSEEQSKPVWTEDVREDDRDQYRNEELCRQIGFLKTAVVVSTEGNDPANIVNAVKIGKEMDAVANFKRKFDYAKENTGIAFLVVCDMLLTGFDAPIEQVMYIDKKVQDHNLLQTIARVNRVAKGKNIGYIVDYVGLTDHLKEALSIYSSDDVKDVDDNLKNISSEFPILESRYRRLIHHFRDQGVTEIEPWVQQQITDPKRLLEIQEHAIEAMKDEKTQRGPFEDYLKKFLQSLDIILPNPIASPFKIPAKRFGYLMMKVKERYKDDSLSIANAGAKVRELINQHLISLGINPKIKPVELMSPKFMKQIELNVTPKAKASEMEHAIRKHLKVNMERDPILYQTLSEKLESLIQQYKENWDELYKHLFDLREEVEAGRENDADPQTGPFYDLIGSLAFGKEGIPPQDVEAVSALVREILELLKATIARVNFWNDVVQINDLKRDLSDKCLYSTVEPIMEQADKIAAEVTSLANVRRQDIVL